MIEAYHDAVSNQTKSDIKITPLVQSMSGVAKVDIEFDYKKYYKDFLAEKYK